MSSAEPPSSGHAASPPAAEERASDDEAEDDKNEAEMPLTMAASVILSSLPRDAHAALEGAGQLPQASVKVRFRAVGAAPQLRTDVFKIDSNRPFSAVVASLRRRLKLELRDSVLCYINRVFTPNLDEAVGNLWRCFKTGDELVVSYAKTPAFG